MKKLKQLHAEKKELIAKLTIINSLKNEARRKAYKKFKNTLKALENRILAIEEQINQILGS